MSLTGDERDEDYTSNDIEEERLEGQRYRKTRLKSDAYNYKSDSSSEDYNPGKENEDESNSEDDMFAYENKDEDRNESNSRMTGDEGILSDDEFARESNEDMKMDNSFLNKESVYGQEEQEDADKLREEQVDYYTGIEKYDDISSRNMETAKIAPQIEKFAMEKDEAEIDEDGNYVPHRNVGDSQDEEWMNMKKKDILKVKNAQTQRKELSRKRREAKQLTELAPLESLLKTLIHLIEEGETPMIALGRLLPRKSRVKKNANKELDFDERVRRATAMKITDLCESLIEDKGITDIYELSKEQLIQFARGETSETFSHSTRKRTHEELEAEEAQSDNASPDNDTRKWEFKWEGDDTIHGTYTDYEMYYWSQNCFEDRVVVRKKNDLNFVPIYEINFQV